MNLMKQTLVIENLCYEELVLLQQILFDLEQKGQSAEYDQEIFNGLYEKVMVS
jgi:hypothetical protein